MSDVYEKLLSISVPKGLFPEGMTNIMAEATKSSVTVEQAEFLLESAEEFEERFGAGEYSAVSARVAMAMMSPLMGSFEHLVGPPGEELARELERTANNDLVSDAKIIPASGFGSKAVVQVRYGDGEWVHLFDFWDQELSFSPEDFIGKDEDAAHAVFTEKDIRYIQKR